MYTKVAMALAIVFGKRDGRVGGIKNLHQGQNLYDLNEKIHRDTFTHD